MCACVCHILNTNTHIRPHNEGYKQIKECVSGAWLTLSEGVENWNSLTVVITSLISCWVTHTTAEREIGSSVCCILLCVWLCFCVYLRESVCVCARACVLCMRNKEIALNFIIPPPLSLKYSGVRSGEWVTHNNRRYPACVCVLEMGVSVCVRLCEYVLRCVHTSVHVCIFGFQVYIKLIA